VYPGQGVEESVSFPVCGSGGVSSLIRPSSWGFTLDDAIGARAI
jgi:hypothetical protein